MATFEYRRKELTETLDRIKSTIPAEELGELQNSCNLYSKGQDEVLTSLSTLVGDTGSNLQAANWKDNVTRGPNALKDTIDSALRKFPYPSPAAWAFQNATMADENRFWSSLLKLDLGARRDELWLLSKNLEDLTKTLQEKWNKMLVENQPLLDGETKAAKQIVEWVELAIAGKGPWVQQTKSAVASAGQEVVDAGRDFAEYAKDQIKQAGVSAQTAEAIRDLSARILGQWARTVAPRITSVVNTVGEVARVVARNIPILNTSVQNEVANYTREFLDMIRKQTGGIFVVFSQTRQDTDKFVREHGFDVAKNLHQQTSENLNRWANDLPTDGLKNDAKDFAKLLLAALDLHLKNMETTFNTFVKQNETRFFGPIGPDTIRALTQEDRWNDDLARLLKRTRDLEETLKDWRSEAHQILELDLDLILKDFLPHLDFYPEDAQREIRNQLKSAREQVKQAAEQQKAIVDENLERVKQQAGPDKMQQDLDRRLLLEWLRK